MTAITPEVLRTVRLRSGIEVVNGITGETGPTFSEYVLLSDYQDLQNAHAAALEELARLKAPVRAPVQGFSAGIPWDMHLRAYDAYCKRYSPQEALIQGGCRGGFAVEELDEFIPGWRAELSALESLAAQLAEREAELAKCKEFEDAMFPACCYLDRAIPVQGYATNADRVRAATDALIAARAELARLKVLLGEVRNLWPDIRQLQDGFMAGDPNFSERDHSVRDRCIAMSFKLENKP